MSPRRLALELFVVANVAAMLVGFGCKKAEDEQPTVTLPTVSQPLAPASSTPAPSAASAPGAPVPAPIPAVVPGPAAVAAGMSGTIKATPNPVPVCEKTGLGVTTISWTAKGTKRIEVRIDNPNGNILTWNLGKKGSTPTGPWVRTGMTFYLQNAAEDVPRTGDHSLARVTVDTVAGGPCP